MAVDGSTPTEWETFLHAVIHTRQAPSESYFPALHAHLREEKPCHPNTSVLAEEFSYTLIIKHLEIYFSLLRL